MFNPVPKLMVIEKHNFTKNRSHPKWNGRLVAIFGILGFKIISPNLQRLNIIYSGKQNFNDFICNLIPLHDFGGHEFRNNIIKEPID